MAEAKVLVAFDFGEHSLEALRQARELAHGLGATLAVCHVLPSERDLTALFPALGGGTASDSESEDQSARVALAEHARTKLGLELSEIFVERGTVYAELVRRSETWGADFVVIGSHGRTGLARAFLGSVAERVVRYAHCSVLVARPVRSAACVLAATDLSDPSLPAIAAGAAAAKRAGVPLVVVSVLEWNDAASLAGGMFGVLPALPPEELKQELRSALRTTLEAAMARVGAVGEARVLDGPAAATIIGCAEELQAALVVVGTHGRTGLARLALGSVAEHVIRNAGCSVLAVRLRTP